MHVAGGSGRAFGDGPLHELTDAGLEHVKGLTQLQFLYVWDTGVTEAGAERLKESLPELLIRLKQE